MQNIGDLLTIGGGAFTIAGIALTFMSYLGEHSGITLSMLEPGMVAQWNRARAWMRRRTGRTETIHIQPDSATSRMTAGDVTLFQWSPLQPEDTDAERIEKLAQNLDRLREHHETMRGRDLESVRKLGEGMTQRITALDKALDEHRKQTARSSVATARWQVRGLGIAFFGAVLSIIGVLL